MHEKTCLECSPTTTGSNWPWIRKYAGRTTTPNPAIVDNMPENVPIDMDFDLEDDAPFTFVGGDGDQNEGGNCFA